MRHTPHALPDAHKCAGQRGANAQQGRGTSGSVILSKDRQTQAGAPGALNIDKRAVRRIFQQVYKIASSKPVVRIVWRFPLVAAVPLYRARWRTGRCHPVG